MHHQKKHTCSSSWDQTACRALGEQGCREERHLACSEQEAPAADHTAPQQAHKHSRITRYTQDATFMLRLTMHVLGKMCTYQHRTHRHASSCHPYSMHRWTRKQRQQTNKQQINIMAATETADHTVALRLSPSPSSSLGKAEIDRERDLERGEWKRVCGWAPTLNSKQGRKINK